MSSFSNTVIVPGSVIKNRETIVMDEILQETTGKQLLPNLQIDCNSKNKIHQIKEGNGHEAHEI